MSLFSVGRTAARRAVAGLALVGALGATAACGVDGAEPTPITLVVDTFGSFGYEELYERYEAANPHITIEERNADGLDSYWPKLTQYLTAGSGAGDVVALEEGIIPLRARVLITPARRSVVLSMMHVPAMRCW